jgi:uncharacterized protein (TIGR00299 family) protein
MKTICFDPVCGASGDMTLAALFDLGVDPVKVEKAVKSTGLHGFHIHFERRQAADHMGYGFCTVEVDHDHVHLGHGHGHEHEHRNLATILHMIEHGEFAKRAKDRAVTVFKRLGDAEAKAHGIPVDQVHFHEVGAVDSIVDIVGSCVALEELGVDKIFTAPLKVGHGTIECAHGVIPVPAPATVNLLEGWPFERLDIEAELTTPTGAALLTSLSDGVWTQQTGRCLGCGHGHGVRELKERPNVLRAFLMEVEPGENGCEMIEFEVDDDSPECVAAAVDRLRDAGALDVLTYPVAMKKGRQGTAVRVICEVRKTAELARQVLAETSTLGVRVSLVRRMILEREIVAVDTPWGPVNAKRVERPGGRVEVVPEFEACRQVAEREGVPLRQVYREVAVNGG